MKPRRGTLPADPPAVIQNQIILPNKSLDITPTVTVHELLEAYPELETVLIRMAPPFKKLRNPILRKSVAKIATLKQAAAVGRIPLTEMISILRSEVGQSLPSKSYDSGCYLGDRPDWFSPEIVSASLNVAELDANEMPITRLLQVMRDIEPGAIVELETSFLPAPGIDVMKAKGYQAWCYQVSDDKYRSYFLKDNRKK